MFTLPVMWQDGCCLHPASVESIMWQINSQKADQNVKLISEWPLLSHHCKVNKINIVSWSITKQGSCMFSPGFDNALPFLLLNVDNIKPILNAISRAQNPSKECEPYRTSDKPIAPCGAIANSLFNGETFVLVISINRAKKSIVCRCSHACKLLGSFPPDTLELFYIDPNGTRTQIPLMKKGIAWWTDKHVKFRNPGGTNLNLSTVFQGKLILTYLYTVVFCVFFFPVIA